MRSTAILIVLSALSGILAAQEVDPSISRINRAVLDAITEASPADSLRVLKSELERIPYRAVNPEEYARMVNGAFEIVLAKPVPHPDDVREAEQDYLLSALEDPDRLPVDLEVEMVRVLRSGERVHTEEERAKVRRRMALFFHAWLRMERETNPRFNSHDWPTENVPLPPGVNGVAGMDPADIADFHLRQQYLDAIKANEAKARESNRQNYLREHRATFLKRAEGFLVSAIASGAVAEAEVESNLTLVKDDAAREHAVARIRGQQQ